MNQRTLLLFLAIMVAVNACQNIYDIGYSSCMFHVNHLSSSCSDFSFNYCTWSQCVAWNYNSGGPRRCIAYTTITNNAWSSCTQKCCDPSVSYPLNSDSISQCQDYINSSVKKTIIIVLSVVFGVALIVGIVILICCKCPNICQKIGDCLCYLNPCKICKLFGKGTVGEQEQSSAAGIVKQNTCNLGDEGAKIQMGKVNYTFQPSEWVLQPNQPFILNSVCSICFSDGPSVELECGHYYHRQCVYGLTNGSRQKDGCATCQSKKVHKLKVYCEECFSSYFQANIFTLKNQKHVCPNCIYSQSK